MIVKSLPRLTAGQTINAANLYTVYTNIWVEREEQKGRILDKQIKLQLMLELTWRLWHEEKDMIHYRELAPFVEKLITAKAMEFFLAKFSSAWVIPKFYERKIKRRCRVFNLLEVRCLQKEQRFYHHEDTKTQRKKLSVFVSWW